MADLPSSDGGASALGSARGFVRALIAALPGRAWLVVALMLVGSITEGIGILLLLPLLSLVGFDAGGASIDRVGEVIGRSLTWIGVTPTLPALLVTFVAIIVARSALRYWESVAVSAIDRDFVQLMRLRLHHAVMRSEWKAFARRRPADVAHALVDDLHRVRTAATQLARLVTQFLMGAVYVGLAIALSPPLTVTAGVAGAVLLLALRRWNLLARTAGAEVSRAGNAMYVALDDHLTSMHVTKAFGAEGSNVAAFAAVARRSARADHSVAHHAAGFTALYASGAAVVLAAIVFIATTVLTLPSATLLLLLLVFARLIPRFAAMQTSVHQFVNVAPAFTRVQSLIESCEREAEPMSGANARATLTDGIRFDAVTFGYRAGTAVVERLDLWVPAFATTAVVGTSGAGKSTIADLAMGVLLPDDGRIWIDRRALESETRQAWRSQVGYVPQDCFLFNATIRENLLWAQPHATQTELWEALRLAAAAEFVGALPDGLDTIVGDRGVLVSGGERQRLALARALVRRPALLVLDEATSSLDVHSERAVQAAIEGLAGRTTILIISHRLSTIRGADHIHVLDRGRVVESGRWDELVERRDGRFRALCRAQGVTGGSAVVGC